MREAWDLGEVHEGKVWDVWSGGIPSESPPFPSSLQHLLIQQGEFLYKWPATCCSSFLCFHTGLAMVNWVFQQLPQLWGSTTRKSGSSKSLRHSQEYLLCLFKIQVSGLCPWTFELAEMLTSDSLWEGVTGDPPSTDYHTPHLLPPALCADRALIFSFPRPSDRHVNLWCSVSLYRNFSLSRLEILFLEIVQQEVAITLIFIFFFLFF